MYKKKGRAYQREKKTERKYITESKSTIYGIKIENEAILILYIVLCKLLKAQNM